MKQLSEKRWFNQFGRESKSEAPIHAAAGRRLRVFLASWGGRGDARLSGQRVNRAARLGVRPPSSFLRVGPADRLTTLSPLSRRSATPRDARAWSGTRTLPLSSLEPLRERRHGRGRR